MTTPRVLLLIALLAVLMLVPIDRSESTASLPGEAPRRPMLWVLEGETPVYLFGTIHVPDRRVTELLDVVETAFETSDVFYAELELDPGALAATQGLMMLPGEPWLDEQVGAETWARVVKAVEGGPLPLSFLKHLKPWVLSMQLMQKAMAPEAPEAADAPAGEGEEGEEDGAESEGDDTAEEAGPEEAMDVVLYRNAGAAGMETGGLESLKEQIDVFDSMSASEQIEMLREMLVVVEGQQVAAGEGSEAADVAKEAKAKTFAEQFEGMIRLYRTGDAAGLARLIRTSMEEGGETLKTFMTKLIDDRNVRMADRIVQARAKHAGKTVFIAVGAGHYPGEAGIVALLRAKGHEVRRLEADSELSTVGAE